MIFILYFRIALDKMTSKIATVSNLAFQVFQQNSSIAALGSIAASVFLNYNTSSDVTNNENTSSSSNIFSNKNIPDTLYRLLTSIHSLTPKDVGFDFRLISDSQVYAAPVAYVHIKETEIFSMGIFILRPGSRIPLHDHPNMYGLLYVLHGSVRCRSFTRLKNVKYSNLNLMTPAANNSGSISNGSFWLNSSNSTRQRTDFIMAKSHHDKILTSVDWPLVLSPLSGNFHEIRPVDGPAVFLDILAPPYDHDLGTRECRFYKEVNLPQSSNVFSEGSTGLSDGSESDNMVGSFANNAGSQSIVYLVETNQPMDYWCESTEYVGPSVI